METRNIWPIYVMSKVVPSQAEPSNQALTHLQNVIHAYEWISDKCPVQVPLAHEKIVCCGILFICFVYVFFLLSVVLFHWCCSKFIDFFAAWHEFYFIWIKFIDLISSAKYINEMEWNYQKKHDDFYVILIGQSRRSATYTPYRSRRSSHVYIIFGYLPCSVHNHIYYID